MNKNIGIAIVVAILLLIGVASLIVTFGKKGSQNQSGTEQILTEKKPANASTSLKELLSAGNSQKCTFAIGTVQNGTVYVSNSKMRADFTSNTEGSATTMHMIMDGKTSSSWIDGQNTGFQMSIEENAKPISAEASDASRINLEQKYDYNCESFNPDASLFELPKDVVFTDVSKMVLPPKSEHTTPTDNTAQCAACDRAPADYVAQCKSALGCN